MERLDRILDEYERSVGLPDALGFVEIEDEARKYLTMTPSLLRKLTAQECGEGAYALLQFSWRLQQAINRENGRVRWARASVRKIIATKVRTMSGNSFEERKMLAVRSDDAASKLNDIKVKALLRVERISFLSNKASDLAHSLMALQSTKRGKHD